MLPQAGHQDGIVQDDMLTLASALATLCSAQRHDTAISTELEVGEAAVEQFSCARQPLVRDEEAKAQGLILLLPGQAAQPPQNLHRHRGGSSGQLAAAPTAEQTPRQLQGTPQLRAEVLKGTQNISGVAFGFAFGPPIFQHRGYCTIKFLA
jgi:hypothetical protein